MGRWTGSRRNVIAAMVTLGGRRFKVIDFARRTVAQDHYLMTHMRSTGMDMVMPGDGESQAEYLMRLQIKLIDSQKAPDLLGGYFLPVTWFDRYLPRWLCNRLHVGYTERDWTPAIAAETAFHISRLNTEDDRIKVINLCIEVAFGFFRHAVEQWQPFRDSLAARVQATETPMASVH